MEPIREMYLVLEQMVDCAARAKKEEVFALNPTFERLAHRVYRDPPSEPAFLPYDMCRTSCVMAFELHAMRGRLVKDAQERFAQIEKPE